MKRTLLDALPDSLPRDIMRFASGAWIYDSSCSPEAKVYYIDRDAGYYLKCAELGALSREALMASYFHSKGLGTELLEYVSADRDYMITRAASGEDCTNEAYLSHPERLCDLLATQLRSLHELEFSDCPVPDRVGEYVSLAEQNYKTGNYDKSHFPDSFGYPDAETAYKTFSEGRGELRNEVLIHGDYCLPNVMLDNWHFSAFIDVDHAGIGDRHIDLFWGAWSLYFNLGTDKYRERFFDVYGRDKIDEGLLRTVAAAEVFG